MLPLRCKCTQSHLHGVRMCIEPFEVRDRHRRWAEVAKTIGVSSWTVMRFRKSFKDSPL